MGGWGTGEEFKRGWGSLKKWGSFFFGGGGGALKEGGGGGQEFKGQWGGLKVKSRAGV